MIILASPSASSSTVYNVRILAYNPVPTLPVPQSDHILQQELGEDEDTIIAALLHDIGQFLPLDAAKDVQMGMGDHSVGRVGHETIGEEYLKGLGFGERVSRLVGSHVAAKRWVLFPHGESMILYFRRF